MAVADRVEGPRLLLRRPIAADEATWVALHRDPRTWTHAPHAMPASDADAAQGFAANQAAWEAEGIGFWMVCRRAAAAEVVGVAGLRVADGEDGRFLNLYYRLAHEVRGAGLGRTAARMAGEYATECLPDLPVRAHVKEHNTASMATALRAGMTRIGTRVLPDDLPDEPASTVLELPRVHRAVAFADDPRAQVLDLWRRVTEAGGAVGFLPGAPPADIDKALAGHERAMAAGRQSAALLTEHDGTLIGLGFLDGPRRGLTAHVRTLYRLMVDPRRQGLGLGRLLLAGLHRLAREDGAQIVTIGVRGGTGTDAFYAACGYREHGRLPGGIRVAPGDDRDDIAMYRRLDS